jgi:hypothetical protein
VFARSVSVSMAAVMNRPMWNTAWINSGLSNNDSVTCKYCHDGFSGWGTDEPSPGWYPPMAPSPQDRGLIGDVLGDSVGSGPEETPAGLELEAAWVGEVRAPPAPRESCVPSGLMDFEDSCVVSLALGVGGLVAFRDLPPTGELLVEESGLISWGTLHRGSRITN